jgi:hypothetical protein
MIKSTDKIEFKVWYQLNGEIQSEIFSSFASAAGHADGVRHQAESSVWLDLRATSPDGQSSLSAGLYKYDRKTNTRQVIHKHYIDQLVSMGVR